MVEGPSTIADRVFEAVQANRFYVLTHPDWKDQIETRMQDILRERNPTPVDVQALITRVLGGAGGSQT